MPFFSIITPTYNRAHLVGRAIDSVLAQTFVDFELIIVDDGSTDDTKDLLAGVEDARVRYIYQENGERGKARNTGVQQANGRYVFFLDSDDLIYSHHLQHAFDYLNDHQFPVFFHSRYELVFPNKTLRQPALNPQHIKEKVSRQNQFACQFFLQREVAIAHPFSENRALRLGEDWAVILHIAYRFPLVISNTITAAIVQHEGRSMQIATATDIKTSRALLIADLENDIHIPKKVVGHVYAEFTTLMALSHAIANEKKAAIKTWWQGIIKRPNLIFTRRTLAIFKKIIFNGKA